MGYWDAPRVSSERYEAVPLPASLGPDGCGQGCDLETKIAYFFHGSVGLAHSIVVALNCSD